jgi:hypothetical protein
VCNSHSKNSTDVFMLFVATGCNVNLPVPSCGTARAGEPAYVVLLPFFAWS